MNKAAIVILTYNNLQYNKDCLESIRKYTKEGTYEIIIVDNNSTDGTREWVLEQQGVKVVLNDENTGFPKGCNIGISVAEKDSDILLLNNDTRVTPRWLENLQTCLYSNNEIGAVGAVSLSTANLQGVDFTYNNFDEMIKLADENNISDPSKWEEKLKLIGFCMLIRREALDKIGPLDERYSPGYYEDDDLGLRIVESGYKLMLCHDCFIHHYLGTSFRKDHQKFLSILNTNQEKFTRKWGFTTHTFDYLRSDLIRVIEEPNKDKNLNILELGCGLGVTLLKLKHIYPNSELYGMENDISIRKIAERVANVSKKRIGEFPLDFPEEHFDYIILNNTLEKIENPKVFLGEFKKYLKPNGNIVVAFQNIMNHTVIKDLLNGNWFYSGVNILDRKNATFVTAKDIYTMFSECGYINPFIFHWQGWTSEEDNRFIEKICSLGGKDKEYLYRTSSYAAKFQNNHMEKNKVQDKDEVKHLLRRIENDIDPDASVTTLKILVDKDIIDKLFIQSQIEQHIVDKSKVINYISAILNDK